MKDVVLEIRRIDGEVIDEIVADQPKFFHLEMMDDNHCWVAVTLANGQECHINILSRGKLKVSADKC